VRILSHANHRASTLEENPEAVLASATAPHRSLHTPDKIDSRWVAGRIDRSSVSLAFLLSASIVRRSSPALPSETGCSSCVPSIASPLKTLEPTTTPDTTT